MSDPRPRVLQMGPDPAIGGGMAAAITGLLASPLAERYRLDVAPTYRDPRPLPRLAIFLAALARLTVWSLRGRGRVVHIHATVRGSAYRKAACVLLAKVLRRRVVLQVHSGAGDIAAFRAGRGRFALALPCRAFRWADVVLAVSEASARALAAAGVSRRIEVVPNAAPPVADFERQPPADGTVGVAYLGGFANPAKGGDLLLATLALCLEEEPRLRVTLAGPGEPPAPDARLLERETGWTWLGWLDREARDSLLRSAEVLVISSRSEGLPIVLLEAMAHGMAIVTTAVGGIAEVVRDGVDGILVQPEEPAALAGELVRLARDPELRHKLGDAARVRAAGFSSERVARRLAALYESLA